MPRGFVAETFCLDTNKGKFFIKIIKNPRFADNIPYSLEVQSRIAKRLDFVPSPVKTVDNKFLWTTDDNIAVCLFEYIDGKPNTADKDGNPHGAENDFTKVVPLAAEIYNLKIECKKKETFPILLRREMERFLEGKMKLTAEVTDFIKGYITYIQNKWNEYNAVCDRLSGINNNFYLTHGDMPGNLVKDKNNKLHIIDWDDILLAPIERDFWFYMDSEENIRKITGIFNNHEIKWDFNKDYYLYYLFTRFFEDLYGYMEMDSISMTGRKNAQLIKTEVFDWLMPMMDT